MSKRIRAANASDVSLRQTPPLSRRIDRRTFVRVSLGAIALAVGGAHFGNRARTVPDGLWHKSDAALLAKPANVASGGGDTASDIVDVRGQVREDGAVQRMEVICRDALGLDAAGPNLVGHHLSTITLHHTGVALGATHLAPSRLRQHQRVHQQHGWADIAYHFAVDPDGAIYELRDPGYVGDTFTNYDPSGHFLIVCEGNYEQEQPTAEMLAAVAALCAYASQTYNIAIGSLSGHRDHAATLCPGKHLARQIGDIEAAARELADMMVVERMPLCGTHGRDRVAAIERH